jgi:hypothetical protein
VVIGARQGARYDSPKLRAFRESEHLSQMGLGGFWRYTCERFFVLEEHMRANGLAACVHLESDNLLYAPPSEYEGWLRDAYGDGIATTPLTPSEDTAAFLYVGSLGALAEMTEAMLELVRMPPASLLSTFGGEMANEMRMLHVIRNRSALSHALPVTIEEAAAAGSAYIFDAGSYGQFVDGSHSAPGIPFTSDQHLVGPSLADGTYRLLWDAPRQAPFLHASGHDLSPLANLHIHSKRLEPWRSRPLEPPRRPVRLASEAGLKRRLQRAANSTLATASRIRRGG